MSSERERRYTALTRKNNRVLSVNGDEMDLCLGLFGTCAGVPWRETYFIPRLKSDKLPFFNPLSPTGHSPQLAAIEARHMANDRVIVLPVSKESQGIASLAETGWAVLRALLDGKDVSIYVQRVDGLDETSHRARELVLEQATTLEKDYPVFFLTGGIEEMADWAVIKMKEHVKLRGSKIQRNSIIRLPDLRDDLVPIVGLFGNTGNWRDQFKEVLDRYRIRYYDPVKTDWTVADIPLEAEFKKKAKVVVCAITGETEGAGALADTGWMAIRALLTGQKLAFFFQDFGSDHKSPWNRGRKLVTAHINELNRDYPGLITIANSLNELQAFAISAMLKNQD